MPYNCLELFLVLGPIYNPLVIIYELPTHYIQNLVLKKRV